MAEFESDLMGIHVVEHPSATPNAHFCRGLEPRDFAADPIGGTGYARPMPFPVWDRAQIIAEIERQERNKETIFDTCQAAGLKPLDQGYTNTCWFYAVVDAIRVRRAQIGVKNPLLSVASGVGPLTNYANARGRPASVGGYGLQAVKFIAKHGLVTDDKWPSLAFDPKYDTPEVQSIRAENQIDDWLDLDLQWRAVWTCNLLGYPCPVALPTWRHEVNAIRPGLQGTGSQRRIVTLVRNTGYGRDSNGYSWIPESWPLGEALAITLSN